MDGINWIDTGLTVHWATDRLICGWSIEKILFFVKHQLIERGQLTHNTWLHSNHFISFCFLHSIRLWKYIFAVSIVDTIAIDYEER